MSSKERNREKREQWEREAPLREAARVEERLDEVITRRELLDAFGTIRFSLNQSGSVGADIYALLDAIESAFE